MWIDKALPYGADILLSAYAVYLFFCKRKILLRCP